jgi:uncharacterized protein YvpB
MPRFHTTHKVAPFRRHRLFALLCYIAVLSLLLPFPLDVAQPALASPSEAAPAIPLRPYAYATANSATGYDILVGDGLNKDTRIARVKVDSLYFTDVTARLSTDATQVAFRVTGDRNGGSSLYSVHVASGKFVQVAATKSNSEGIGAYVWSPAGNTLAFVRSAPALDPALMDDAFGTIHVYSVGFQATRLKSSNGNDRLLGFAGDGLGVYVARRESLDNVTLEHLVYLPLAGASATTMIKSQPGLRYSNYALLAPPRATPKLAFVAEGDFALAAQNSNAHEVTPGSAVTVTVASKAPGAARLVRPTGLGLVTSDTLGRSQTLLRRDAEDYAHLSWAPDGSALLVGSNRGSWRVGLDGSRLSLGTSVAALHPAAASREGTFVVMSDNPATRLVTLDYATGKVSATKYVGVTPKPAAATMRLRVPYIHQVNDTVGSADGDWACGPTSVVMTLAYYGKLEPWYVNQNNRVSGLSGTPIPTRAPVGVDYAPYITNEYAHNGHTYSATARDPSGNQVAGLYGTICPTGNASWPVMSQVLSWHGLQSQRVSLTWDGIVAALKRGHPVLLGNKLTSEGHILVVIGYTADGNLVVNDPYGNKFAPGYGSNDGNGILYPWKRITPRTALEVIGVYPPPTATPVPPTATPVPTAQPAFMPAP